MRIDEEPRRWMWRVVDEAFDEMVDEILEAGGSAADVRAWIQTNGEGLLLLDLVLQQARLRQRNQCATVVVDLPRMRPAYLWGRQGGYCHAWTTNTDPRRVLPVRYVLEGEEIPAGWGVAWRDPVRRVAFCSPVPLNWVFGAAYRVWWWLVAGPERRPRWPKPPRWRRSRSESPTSPPRS